MKLTTTLLLTLTTSVLAMPIIPRDDPPAKTHLYVCDDASFKGICENFEVELGKCYNVPDNWSDKISSGGPDKNTFCSVYPNYECTGKALPFENPGTLNLTRYGYGDMISSYRCDFLGGFDGPNQG